MVEPRHCMFEYTETCINPNVSWKVAAEEEGVSYNARRVNMSRVEMSVAIPDELKQLVKDLWDQEKEQIDFRDLYESGPRYISRFRQIREDEAYRDEDYDYDGEHQEEEEEEENCATHSPIDGLLFASS